MRVVAVSVIALSVALPASAQTSVNSFELLQSIVKPGQTLVVTDQAGHETTGSVSEVSALSLTLALKKHEQRVFAGDTVRAIRRTDPLGNGTLVGLGIGIAATSTFAARCGRYKYAEESGPCMAAAMSSGLLWIPMAALIGRAIDRAHGNAQLYRR